MEYKFDIVDKKNVENMKELIRKTNSFLEKYDLTLKNNFELSEFDEKIDYAKNIGLLQVEKLVYEKDESILDRLSSVYSSLYWNKASVFMIIDSDGKECKFYLGVKRTIGNVFNSFVTLQNSLKGNFEGINTSDRMDREECEELMDRILNENPLEITTVLGIPLFKRESNEKFLKGIEKVIYGMEGKKFTGIFIADPISDEVIKNKRESHEELYNKLVPYFETSISLNESNGKSKTNGTTKSSTKNESEKVQKSQNEDKTTLIEKVKKSENDDNNGVTKKETETKSETKTSFQIIEEINGKSTQDSESSNDSSGKTLQYSQKNKTVEVIIQKIEKHLERIKEAEGNGAWNMGVYFLSSELQNATVASNLYNGLISDREPNIERKGIYHFDTENKRNTEILKDYLRNFCNPKIQIEKINNEMELGNFLTNEELVLKMNLPQKTVYGLDVVEMATFGRNIHKTNKRTVKMGQVYHLGKTSQTEVELDINSLSSHTFITGSTGSGKSTAVYQMINELRKNDIKFMIVEPAKGEYKNVFGGRDDVAVYGTNERYTDLLRINPFNFNENIHVLEHIDRLIEIISACWSMEAAMKPILKASIERVYVDKGWDLKSSQNILGLGKLPTLEQLIKTLKEVIEGYGYTGENKSAYNAALTARITSLKNGLLGNILVEDEICDEDLFDKNVIIDISRIPSMETKSLIMGMLFMKLIEYRTGGGEEPNQSLKHVMVLEEAHNLLKRSSPNSGNGDLLKRSVEMMSNAIAEMRTYGQGFIIADQAPGLLDESVIRNTNTKICLRLPDKDDREILGKSMNLNDEQINELSKLRTGVAAIIQNNWEEASLVKIDEFKEENYRKLEYNPNEEITNMEDKMKSLLEGKKMEDIQADDLYNALDTDILWNILNNNFDRKSDGFCKEFYDHTYEVLKRYSIENEKLTEDLITIVLKKKCDEKNDPNNKIGSTYNNWLNFIKKNK